MGSTVSVCNLTNVVLNLALSQVGPLYYQNRVHPGQCMTHKVGKVWFSVEARLWYGQKSEYTPLDVINPILDMVDYASLIIDPEGTMIELDMIDFVSVISRDDSIGFRGKIKGIIKTIMDTKKSGVYMGHSRTINIRGGPTKSQINVVNGKQRINIDQSIDRIYVE